MSAANRYVKCAILAEFRRSEALPIPQLHRARRVIHVRERRPHDIAEAQFRRIVEIVAGTKRNVAVGVHDTGEDRYQTLLTMLMPLDGEPSCICWQWRVHFVIDAPIGVIRDGGIDADQLSPVATLKDLNLKPIEQLIPRSFVQEPEFELNFMLARLDNPPDSFFHPNERASASHLLVFIVVDAVDRDRNLPEPTDDVTELVVVETVCHCRIGRHAEFLYFWYSLQKFETGY